MRWEELSWDKVKRAQMRWSVECEECSVKCGAWKVQCEEWSVKCGVWRKQWKVRSVDCEVWSVKCEAWSAKCEVWSVKCEVWNVKSAVRSVKCEVELQMWHVQQDTTFAKCTHARAWLVHGACKFYRCERFIYIPKATSAPPRPATAGTVNTYTYIQYNNLWSHNA